MPSGPKVASEAFHLDVMPVAGVGEHHPGRPLDAGSRELAARRGDHRFELAEVRRVGYAVDEGEQEIGVRCVGVAVPGAPQPMALSLSGPLARVNDELVQRAHQVLGEAAAEIRAVLSRPGSEA